MNHKMVEEAIRNLGKNRIGARVFIEPRELRAYLDDQIDDDSVVGVGDSVTLTELGIYRYLRERNIGFLDKYDESLSKDEKRRIYTRNFSADVFFSGINALTLGGKIFNLDGNGSRVAPIIYGPNKVYLICGTNKIVKDDNQAIERIKNTAAPLDAIRLKKKTPCITTKKCMDCHSPERICNYYSIIQGQFNKDRIEVLLISGEYGY